MKQPHSCSDTELYQGIDQSHHAISAISRGQLRFIREFDKRALWKKDGAKNMGEWLAARLGISLAEGLRRTTAAHAMEELPAISHALKTGALSLDKAQLLASFATPATEADLLRWARRATVSAIWKRAARIGKKPDNELKDAHQRRYLSIYPDPEDDSCYFQGEVPTEQGAIITKALDRLAARIPVLPGETYNLERKRVDALVALASARIAADPDPDRATVVMHAQLGAGVGEGNGPNPEIEKGPVIHPDIARRISCDCRLQVILQGVEGNLLGIGDTSRIIPAGMWRALLARDGGCVFPGCGTTRFTEGHHIWHWEFGGPTQPDNLVVLCRFHHDLLHKFGWKVALDENEIAHWYRPSGEPFEPQPRQTTIDEEWAAIVRAEWPGALREQDLGTTALTGFG